MTVREPTVRLTCGQAVIKYLAAQWSEFERRTTAGDPGNVRDLRSRERVWPRSGARRDERCHAVLSTKERAVDGAYRHRVCQGDESHGHPCLFSVDRARCHEHVDRCRNGDRQSRARPTVTCRYVRQPSAGPADAGPGPPIRGRHVGERCFSTGQSVLRPDCQTGASTRLSSCSDARVAGSSGDGRCDDFYPPRRAGGGVRTFPRASSTSMSGSFTGGRPLNDRWKRRST